MLEDLPIDGDFIIERIQDTEVIARLESMRVQMRQAIYHEPEREGEIRARVNADVNKLLDWYEHEIVRWTICPDC